MNCRIVVWHRSYVYIAKNHFSNVLKLLHEINNSGSTTCAAWCWDNWVSLIKTNSRKLTSTLSSSVQFPHFPQQARNTKTQDFKTAQSRVLPHVKDLIVGAATLL